MTNEEARNLLDAYYEARRDEVECPEWPEDGCLRQDQIAEQAWIAAITHSETIAEQLSARLSHAELTARRCAETIAEQQREIERLSKAIDDYAIHHSICAIWLFTETGVRACTCGLDEVLK